MCVPGDITQLFSQRDSLHYNKAIDMFSCGCILAEMVTGKTLFGGRNEMHHLVEIYKYTCIAVVLLLVAIYVATVRANLMGLKRRLMGTPPETTLVESFAAKPLEESVKELGLLGTEGLDLLGVCHITRAFDSARKGGISRLFFLLENASLRS